MNKSDLGLIVTAVVVIACVIGLGFAAIYQNLNGKINIVGTGLAKTEQYWNSSIALWVVTTKDGSFTPYDVSPAPNAYSVFFITEDQAKAFQKDYGLTTSTYLIKETFKVHADVQQ